MELVTIIMYIVATITFGLIGYQAAMQLVGVRMMYIYYAMGLQVSVLLCGIAFDSWLTQYGAGIMLISLIWCWREARKIRKYIRKLFYGDE